MREDQLPADLPETVKCMVTLGATEHHGDVDIEISRGAAEWGLATGHLLLHDASDTEVFEELLDAGSVWLCPNGRMIADDQVCAWLAGIGGRLTAVNCPPRKVAA